MLTSDLAHRADMAGGILKNQEVKRTIGFCAAAWQGIAGRWVEGALRYMTVAPGLALRDFSFLEEMEMNESAPLPVWRGKTDGMILAFGMRRDERLEDAIPWIERGGVPAVSLVWEWSDPRIPVVTTDFHAVIKVAAEYLIRQDFRHFVFIGTVACDPAIMAENHRVFDRVLAAHRHRAAVGYDLSFRADGVREDLERVRGEKDLVRLLRETPKPLAVFAMNDYYARAVCHLCEELGLEVPGEVAVLGCGDLAISRCGSPTISSVRTAAETVGYEAAKLLHRLIDGAPLPEKPLLIGPERVVERESTDARYRESGDVRRALEFIRQHACDGIKVPDVVRHLRIARRTLDKHFSDRLGHSPAEEIQRVRLERAKELLAGTSLSVGKVAELAGFNDLALFNASFRKQTGLPPTGFRKREQK